MSLISCPTDAAIFPSLNKIPNSKSLQGKFDAFKFADDEIVRFQVNVHFCLHECGQPQCDPILPNLTEEFNTSITTTDSPTSINDTLPERFFNRKKRETTRTNNQLKTVLPDYPLQKEIIVEGLSSAQRESSDNYSRKGMFNLLQMLIIDSLLVLVYESPSLICTSRITLFAAFIATLVFQTSLIAFCCSCIFFWKMRPSKTRRLSREKFANYYTRRNYPASWCSLSVND